MFLLQKIVAPLFFPLNICLEIMFVGLVLLWFSKRQKLGKIFVTGGCALLLLFSYNFFCNFSLGLFEDQYQPFLTSPGDAKEPTQYAGIKWIVVLGGGHVSDTRLSALARLSERSLGRVVEAVRLHRLLPHTKILFSGGAVFEASPEADSMAEAAMSLGVNKSDVVCESQSRDTKGQAVLMRELLGQDRFVLVTSAAHMPRAAAMFRKQGFDFIPAPCDQRVKDAAWAPSSFYPNPGALHRSENAIYEFLGLIIAKLIGRI